MELINTNVDKITREMGVISTFLCNYRDELHNIDRAIVGLSILILGCELLLLGVLATYIAGYVRSYVLVIFNLCNLLLITLKIIHERTNRLLPVSQEYARLSFIEEYVNTKIFKEDADVDALVGLLDDLRKINS